MIRIVGIAGSWRRGSYNAALLRAARDLMPDGAKLEIAAIRDIPLYNGDVEAEVGLPDTVVEVKEAIAGAQGVLIATPEYNRSIPGTLKNAVDWTSRPPRDIPRVWGGRPVAIIGASPGPGGTRMAQAAWLPVFRRLKAQLFTSMDIQLSEAGKLFDGDGVLADERTRGELAAFLARFVDFARAVAAPDRADRALTPAPAAGQTQNSAGSVRRCDVGVAPRRSPAQVASAPATASRRRRRRLTWPAFRPAGTDSRSRRTVASSPAWPRLRLQLDHHVPACRR